MENSTAERLIEMNRRLIEAMGMHWENELDKLNGYTPSHTSEDFANLAHKHLEP